MTRVCIQPRTLVPFHRTVFFSAQFFGHKPLEILFRKLTNKSRLGQWPQLPRPNPDLPGINAESVKASILKTTIFEVSDRIMFKIRDVVDYVQLMSSRGRKSSQAAMLHHSRLRLKSFPGAREMQLTFSQSENICKHAEPFRSRHHVSDLFNEVKTPQ